MCQKNKQTNKPTNCIITRLAEKVMLRSAGEDLSVGALSSEKGRLYLSKVAVAPPPYNHLNLFSEAPKGLRVFRLATIKKERL